MIYINNLLDTIGIQLLIIVLFAVLVLGAAMIDLIIGVRKSKRAGNKFGSSPLKRSVTKLLIYFSTLVLAGFIDTAQMVMVHSWTFQHSATFPVLPFFSFVVTVLLLTVEIKSVLETSEQKDKARMLEIGKMYYNWAASHKIEFKEFNEMMQNKKPTTNENN